MSRAQLARARAAKNDEFYTRKEDIEAELKHYRPQFHGKRVFCNCDDPAWSEFFRYFVRNYDSLNLSGVVSTHYEYGGKPSYMLKYNGKMDPHEFLSRAENGGRVNGYYEDLKENGDFRSSECMKLLGECDIVCTNPPFSIWPEYLKTLIDSGKEFLILGDINKIAFKGVWPYIGNGKVWLGVSNGAKNFRVPEGTAAAKKVGDSWFRPFGNVVWYTNLTHPKRKKDRIILFRRWHKDKDQYQEYDNFNAIDVGEVKRIPAEYKGLMGVPITFLTKHNPDQFEIVHLGKADTDFTFKPDKIYGNLVMVKGGERKFVKGRAINNFLTLLHSEKPEKTHYEENGKYYTVPFARILIRAK